MSKYGKYAPWTPRRGWRWFWGLSWWWKAPILAVGAIVLIGVISAAAGGGGDSGGDKPAAVQATANSTAITTVTARPTPGPTFTAVQVYPTPTPTEPPPPWQVAAVPGAVAERNHVRVYFNAMIDPYTPDNPFNQPPAGSRFVTFDVTIEYLNDSSTHGANPFNFGLTDTNAFSYEHGFIIDPEPELNAVELRPGEKTRGWIGFKINAGSVLDTLRYQPNPIKDEYIEFRF